MIPIWVCSAYSLVQCASDLESRTCRGLKYILLMRELLSRPSINTHFQHRVVIRIDDSTASKLDQPRNASSSSVHIGSPVRHCVPTVVVAGQRREIVDISAMQATTSSKAKFERLAHQTQ